jgi:hypothetical protein
MIYVKCHHTDPHLRASMSPEELREADAHRVLRGEAARGVHVAVCDECLIRVIARLVGTFS